MTLARQVAIRWLSASTTSSCSARPASPAALTAEYLAASRAGHDALGAGGPQPRQARGRPRRLAEISPASAQLPLLARRRRRRVVDARAGGVHAGRDHDRRARTSSYGEPLVAACAAAGTDYVDLTGEPEFVDLMWLRYHEQAQQTGARLVHSCGFDSIPYDLGALFTVQQLPEGVPIELEGFVRAGGDVLGRDVPLGAAHHGPRCARGCRSPPSASGASRARRAARARRPGQAAPRRRGRRLGRCRCRRSTRRPCCARRARSTATARTSATATTSSSSSSRSLVGLGVGVGAADRARAAPADARPAAQAQGPRRGPVARAAREGAGSRSRLSARAAASASSPR